MVGFPLLSLNVGRPDHLAPLLGFLSVDRPHQGWQVARPGGDDETRWEGLPDIPPVSDFVPGFETGGLAGFGAPKDTPAEIVQKLNKEVNAALDDAKVKARLVELGGTILLIAHRFRQALSHATLSNMTWTCPLIRSVSAAGEPRYGT